ncbi:MAG: hypothetical protein ACOY94_07235 [Bacillota bacterium]
MSTDLVFRALPDAYRRAGADTVVHALTGRLADGLNVLDRHGKQVLQSRFIDHLADLDDAERLAALFALTPWPEEDLGEFRYRIKQMARIYLGGAATAPTLLQVVGAATDSQVAEVVLPMHEPEGGGPLNDRYTTTGILTRRADSAQSFEAQVVELPPVRQEVEVTAATGYVWEVENSTYADPGDYFTPPTYPEPIVDIAAGEHPVTVPILVQRDLRRLLLINRRIPPGASLRVDLQTHTVHDVSGPATLQGPVTIGGAPAPDLVYGTGGLAGDVRAYRLTDPPPRQEAARPFHVLRWNKEYRTGPEIPEVPGPPGTSDPVPFFNIPWPPLLGLGTSRWRLMVGVNQLGLTPTLDETVDLKQLRPVPATAALGPERIRFRWVGRRLATFTVIVPEAQLCDGPAPAGKMSHRADWLREQIMRLKLAGVIYIDPAATALMPEPNEAPAEEPEISLWEVAPATDHLELSINTVDRKAAIKEESLLTDTLSVTVTPSEEEEEE